MNSPNHIPVSKGWKGLRRDADIGKTPAGWEPPWIAHSAFPTTCSGREQPQSLWCLFLAGFSAVPTPIPWICAVSKAHSTMGIHPRNPCAFSRDSEHFWEELGSLSHLWLLQVQPEETQPGRFGNLTQLSHFSCLRAPVHSRCRLVLSSPLPVALDMTLRSLRSCSLDLYLLPFGTLRSFTIQW